MSRQASDNHAPLPVHHIATMAVFCSTPRHDRASSLYKDCLPGSWECGVALVSLSQVASHTCTMHASGRSLVDDGSYMALTVEFRVSHWLPGTE